MFQVEVHMGTQERVMVCATLATPFTTVSPDSVLLCVASSVRAQIQLSKPVRIVSLIMCRCNWKRTCLRTSARMPPRVGCAFGVGSVLHCMPSPTWGCNRACYWLLYVACCSCSRRPDQPPISTKAHKSQDRPCSFSSTDLTGSLLVDFPTAGRLATYYTRLPRCRTHFRHSAW